MWIVNHGRGLAIGLSAVLALQGCAQKGGNAAADSGESSFAKTAMQTIGCIGGAFAGAALAKSLAASEAKRLKLAPAEAAKRERGYQIAFALVGCGGGSALAGTAYSKLGEAGRKAREQELLAAASTSRPRTYKDPDNATLSGQIKPLPVYADAAGHRECRDLEDTLADAGKGEPIVVKYCRNLPNGGWAQVTA